MRIVFMGTPEFAVPSLQALVREGYEIAVSRPEVIFKKIDGKLCEPIEEVICSVPNEYSGSVS